MEDQVRGQNGSDAANFGRGTELRARCDPASKVPSAETMILACGCEKVTGEDAGGAAWLARAHKVIFSGYDGPPGVAEARLSWVDNWCLT